MTEIPLYGRGGAIVAHALIDDADADTVGTKRWFKDGRYATRQVARRKKVYMHRLILGEACDGLQVDHINGDKLDNRRSNLRAVTAAQNMQNRRAIGGTSEHRGVSFNRRAKKWEAFATIATTKQHIGFFADEDDAADAARRFRIAQMPFSVEATA